MKKIVLLLSLIIVLALVATQFLGSGPFQLVEQAVAQEGVEVPFLEQWAGSGHADVEAEAFRHWDEDDPQVVEVDCAKCHSTPGYLDFIGADGSEAGVVEVAPPVDTTVSVRTATLAT